MNYIYILKRGLVVGQVVVEWYRALVFGISDTGGVRGFESYYNQQHF